MTTQPTIPTPEQLTESERAAIQFIAAYHAAHGRSPSFKEIHAAVGIGIADTYGLLQDLVAWGYLARHWDMYTEWNLRVVREI